MKNEDKIISILISLSIIFNILYQLIEQSINLKILSLTLGIVAVLLYLIKEKLDNKILLFWLLFSLYLFLIGIITCYEWPSSLYLLIRIDISVIIMISIGIIIADKKYSKSFHIIFTGLIILAVVVGIYSLLNFRGTIDQLRYRYNGLNEDNYIMWGLLSVCNAYSGYNTFFKKKKIIYILSFLSYILLGLLFQKRVVIVNFLSLIVIYSIITIFSSREEKRIKQISILFVSLILIFTILFMAYIKIPIIHEMIDLTINRLLPNEENLMSYDRQREADFFMERTGIASIITGYGIGHYLWSPTWGYYSSLHIGYYNILYKGGILYILIMLFIIIKSMKILYNIRKYDTYVKIALGITLSFEISMFYELSWTGTIQRFCYVPFIVTILNNKILSYHEI